MLPVAEKDTIAALPIVSVVGETLFSVTEGTDTVVATLPLEWSQPKMKLTSPQP
jgi:hypothetical protein